MKNANDLQITVIELLSNNFQSCAEKVNVFIHGTNLSKSLMPERGTLKKKKIIILCGSYE